MRHVSCKVFHGVCVCVRARMRMCEKEAAFCYDDDDEEEEDAAAAAAAYSTYLALDVDGGDSNGAHADFELAAVAPTAYRDATVVVRPPAAAAAAAAAARRTGPAIPWDGHGGAEGQAGEGEGGDDRDQRRGLLAAL
jgi:hypothetical protein